MLCSLYLNKIMTMRDKDYDLIRKHLETETMMINKTMTKNLDLPYLKK
jgi:hypothetical protein